MKNLNLRPALRTLTIIIGTAGLFACQELSIDTQSTQPAKIEIDAQSEYTLLAASPRTIIFNISSNTPWKITSDSQWCTPDPAMSSASSLVAEITVETEDNDTEKPRTAILTIKAEGIDTPTTVTVHQDAKGKLLIQPVDGAIASQGGSKPFTITSNKPWTVVSDKIWLTFDKTEGEGTGEMETVTATAEMNTGVRRSALVTVSNGLDTQEFEVVQDGIILSFKELEDPENDVLFSGAGGTKSFGVEANIEWKVACDDPNVILNKTSDTEFSVTMPIGKYFSTMETPIRLEAADASLSGVEAQVLTLKQSGIAYADGSGVVFNEDGSVTMTAAGAKSRVCTHIQNKMGTYIWTFSEVNIEDAYFDINASPSGGSANFHIYLGECQNKGDSNSFKGGGRTQPDGADFWANPTTITPGLTVDDLNAMKTLKLVVKPNESDNSKLKVELWLNDKQILEVNNRINPWTPERTTPGMPYYFGFTEGTGTMTIASFETIPIE